MIDLTDIFDMVGTDGCIDVATSLSMQGTDPSISIPIYEILYLRILPGELNGRLAGGLAEYNAIRRLAETCGAVSVQLNILDIDILELAGLLLIATPNTGMHAFAKLGSILVDDLPEEVILNVADAMNMPVPPGTSNLIHFAQDLIQSVFNMFVEKMEDSFSDYGVQLHQWEELPQYYAILRESGEMHEMGQYRMAFGGSIF